MPSPIGKTSSTNNTATSSPNLTMTPASSVDGNGEIFSEFAKGLGGDIRHSASLDFSAGGSATWSHLGMGEDGGDYYSGLTAGLDNENDPDDGLRGLGALRERSQSSPGPIPGSTFVSSPPVRIDVSKQQRDLSPLQSEVEPSRHRGLPPDPRRIRSLKDGLRHSSRPPLSGGGSVSQSSFPDTASSFSSSYHETRTNASFTQQGSLSGFQSDGSFASGRLDHRANVSELERIQGRLTRSASLGTVGNEAHYYERNTHIESFRHTQNIDQELHAHKFGAHHQSYVNNLLHQRIPTSNHMDMPQHHVRHVRSLSHSGPLSGVESHDASGRQGRSFDGGLQYRVPLDLHDGYGGRGMVGGREAQRRSTPNLARSLSTGDRHVHPALQPRSASFAMAGPLDVQIGGQMGLLQRRNSDAAHSYASMSPPSRGQMHPQGVMSMSRYEDSGAPVMATPDEMKMFGIGGGDDRRGSPVNSMLHQMDRRHMDLVLAAGQMPGGASQRVSFRGFLAFVLLIMYNPELISYLTQNASFGMPQHIQPAPGLGRHSSLGSSIAPIDDDLTHPLAGEHIDDPGDDLGYAMSGHGTISHLGGIHHAHQGSMHVSRSPVERRSVDRGRYASHMEPVMPLTAGASFSGPRVVYTVKFKRTQRNFIPASRVGFDIKLGCYVKVEADRGEDLGIVVSKIPAEKLSGAGRGGYRPPSTAGMGGDAGLMSTPTAAISAAGIADLKRIIRLASHDEVSLLAVKRDEEEELLRVCRSKVRQRGLPMNVVDAEYQFDRHKLTFFFEAEGRIDFRELVRDLFSMYKTRIWMQQLDKNASGGVPGVVAPGPGEYGTSTPGVLPQMGGFSDALYSNELEGGSG